MSDVFYPLSLIQKLDSTKVARVIADQFEDGSTATRNPWAAQYFKRRFTLQHSPLTAAEWRYLRSFYSQRSGKKDSFWFRDNVHREGNASVRFAADLQASFQGSARIVQVQFDEVAPIRALPEWEDINTAAGASPLFWFDANRELYYQHLGVAYQPESATAYENMGSYPSPWNAGALSLGGTLSQYQYYQFTGQWARSSINVAGLAGTQPAATVYVIAYCTATATSNVLCAVGTTGAQQALGIMLDSSNHYRPWISGTEAWGTANIPRGTGWVSLCATWAAASNVGNFYAGGISQGTDTNTRSYAAGKATLGAATDGTLILNTANAMTTARIAHALIFPSALTAGQVAALHNLLAPQYGIATI